MKFIPIKAEYTKVRKLIQIELLLFVAVSVVYLVSQESRKSRTASSQPALNAVSKEAARQPKVIVYYFHGNVRCAGCRRLEAVSDDALRSSFSEEIRRGDLQWLSVNVEMAGNEHYVSDYKLFWKALVVVKLKDNRQAEYKQLPKVWELQDDAALKNYVVDEVRKYLYES